MKLTINEVPSNKKRIHYSPDTEYKKGHKPWIKGKHHSEETKRRISETHKGMATSEETKQKISESLKGHKFSKETVARLSNAKIGIMPKIMQKEGTYGHVKRGWYNINGKEMFFRSKWEVNYALYLDFLVKQRQIKKWTYEEDVFIFEKIKFGTRSYRPDFKIYNLNETIEYHEVKGHMTPRSKTQIKRMAKYYPKVRLLIIDKDVYSDIKSKLGKLLKFY